MSNNLNDFFQFRVRSRDQYINSLSQLMSSINSEIVSKEKSISSQRIKLKLSRGIWRSDKRLVEVIVNKNLNHLMGLTIDSIKYLEPFEALYLIESKCLEVFCDDIPLSIEESFKLFLQNQNQIDFYRIYTTLSRTGLFVKKQISFEKNELIANRKRKLSDSDIDYKKQMSLNINYYEFSEKVDNYKLISNIRPINPLSGQSSSSSEDNLRDINSLLPQSVVYEINTSAQPLQLDPSLTLFKGSVKPLCGLGCVYSNNELFNLIQSFGPKTRNSIDSTEYKYEILEVFKNVNKRVNQRPDFNVVLTKSDQTIPQINEIMDLQKKSLSEETYFAVLDSNDFVFYSISYFQLNDEFPLLWQKYFT